MLTKIRNIYPDHAVDHWLDLKSRIQPYIRLSPEEFVCWITAYERIGRNSGFKRYSKKLLALLDK